MRLFFLGMVQFGPDKLIVLNAILHDTSLIVALSLTEATIKCRVRSHLFVVALTSIGMLSEVQQCHGQRHSGRAAVGGNRTVSNRPI